MVNLADQAIATVRWITQALLPPSFDETGLLDAITRNAAVFETQTNIRCEVAASTHIPTIDQTVSLAAFRIAQEALTNVARHAQATRVQIALAIADGQLSMEVVDNGCGITERDLEKRRFGLLGMRTRAGRLGGEVMVRGVAGAGTTIRARLPLTPTRQKEHPAWIA